MISIQMLVEMASHPTFQYLVGGVSLTGIVTGIVGVGLRWDRRIVRMDERMATMCTTEAMKDHVTTENRSLRDDMVVLMLEHGQRIELLDRRQREMQRACDKRHGENGVK